MRPAVLLAHHLGLRPGGRGGGRGAGAPLAGSSLSAAAQPGARAGGRRLKPPRLAPPPPPRPRACPPPPPRPPPAVPREHGGQVGGDNVLPLVGLHAHHERVARDAWGGGVAPGARGGGRWGGAWAKEGLLGGAPPWAGCGRRAVPPREGRAPKRAAREGGGPPLPRPPAPLRRTRVVDEHVEAPPLVGGRLDQRLQVGALGHVPVRSSSPRRPGGRGGARARGGRVCAVRARLSRPMRSRAAPQPAAPSPYPTPNKPHKQSKQGARTALAISAATSSALAGDDA